MCGRMTLRAPVRSLLEEFNLSEAPKDYQPRYNIAPTQPVTVLVERDGERSLDAFKWGLIPSWADDPSIGSRMINARSETVTEKPSFRNAFERRRCLVLADGFYEWKKEGEGKTPYRIRLADERPFGFAGLWERWDKGDGEPILSCTILTTAANATLAPIHDRMPVILPPDSRDYWLGPTADRDALLSLLQPYPPEEMDAYPVSRRVNSPRNEDPSLLEPLDTPS